jgi:hypothetical protein
MSDGVLVSFQSAWVPTRTEEEWFQEMESRGHHEPTRTWSRGLASGELRPYRLCRFLDGNRSDKDPTNVQVSYDGKNWWTYDRTRDRGIG